MEHVENHPHAFVKNGDVINVAVFAEHDQELLQQFAIEFDCDIICCCDNGTANIGWKWDGEKFYNPNPPIHEKQ